ncbi:MAG: hypothetical protein L3J49_00235 [Desulfobulbaceae bacterium]|nr:hypothetical protein [Desulfobulbaceae bacterium]
MKEEEICAVVEAAVKNSAGMDAWQIFMLIVASALAAFFGAYLKEKAKGAATKEDIEEITQKIEGVKREVEKNKEIDSIKYNLKYEACLESLNLIDAHFSHLLTPSKEGDIIKQYASTKDARKCHSKLILSCENTELIEKFDEIMFGPKNTETTSRAPTDLLNDYRNLIRKELEFGVELSLGRDRAWFGKLNCENKNG